MLHRTHCLFYSMISPADVRGHPWHRDLLKQFSPDEGSSSHRRRSRTLSAGSFRLPLLTSPAEASIHRRSSINIPFGTILLSLRSTSSKFVTRRADYGLW
ncbi:hypothetical protein ABVK25_005524 [Lepraria finkii]|uniref:Uncharacterized protein n=1 Tax=Lepraria finkii TaxID=1340010 RepID=A0ABR4BES1_9LECA